MLGTGNALVTECYNTCFVISDGDKNFLVDGGGGSGFFGNSNTRALLGRTCAKFF